MEAVNSVLPLNRAKRDESSESNHQTPLDRASSGSLTGLYFSKLPRLPVYV